MIKSTKKMVIAGLMSGLLISFGVTFGSSSLSVLAAGGQVYYHYAGREADFSTYGIKEYWTNCSGITTIEEPTDIAKIYEFSQKGIAVPELTKDDFRYIAPETADATSNIPTSEEIQSVTIVDNQPGNTNAAGGETENKGPKVVDQNGKDTGIVIEETNKNNNGGTTTAGENTEYTLVGYTGTSETVIIPEGVVSIDTWNNHPVDCDKNENVANITTVVIPDTVEELTVQAFENMPNLETLVIGAKTLNYGCIQNCPKLKYIYITKNCEYILETAFRISGTQDIKIFVEHTSKPAGWVDMWNISSWEGYPHPRYDTKWGVKY